MKIGSIRVSKQEQKDSLQANALTETAVKMSTLQKMTGAKFERDRICERINAVWLLPMHKVESVADLAR